jgi:DNA-binding MarR family transcriptional regulator
VTDLGPGQVLFHFVRHWSRRLFAADTSGEQGRLVLVCEAVYALTLRRTPATVNAIAQEVGIDQSGASRLIKSATSAGYLVMAASAADGRRREASLTSEGRSMLNQAHRWQEEVFAEMTSAWTNEKRRDFQQAMTDLVERSYTREA